MIETTTVSGRPAVVAYIGADGEPSARAQAKLIKVLFTDAAGGVAFLVDDGAAKSAGNEYVFASLKRTSLQRLDRSQNFAVARAQALSTLARLSKAEWNEGDHPRVPAGSPDGGQFGAGGGSSESQGGKDGDSKVALDKEVVDVGGDQWNRETAHRLETEFQTAKPQIEKLERQAIGEEQETPRDEDEDDPPFVPDEWASLGDSDQETIKEEYASKMYDDYYQGEVDNWQSEQAPDEASQKVAEDFNGGMRDDIEWAKDALDELNEQRVESGKPPLPFTTDQIVDALNISYETGTYPKSDPEFEFDDALLTEPEGYDPAQQTLPGVTPVEPHEYLSDKMRDEITAALTPAFEQRAEKVLDTLEAPDYLADNAKEFAAESFDSMDDSEKFSWAESNTDIISNYEQEAEQTGYSAAHTLDQLPTVYDPLNETSGEDYKRTQFLARYLSRERAKQVLEARGLEVPSDQMLTQVDNQLWRAWKSSSTSQDGMLLQAATAEELKGRLNAKTRSEINVESLKEYADGEYQSIGGYKGVLAYVRAKWETTQYLLDKAETDELELYRGITLDSGTVEKIAKHAEAGRDIEGHRYMPTIEVMRNGAASTTTSPSVANGWGADRNRVVLRAVIPRTAAISIPAYGINVQSEKEVVVAGTAWKGWDAWRGRAPELGSVPLQHAA